MVSGSVGSYIKKYYFVNNVCNKNENLNSQKNLLSYPLILNFIVMYRLICREKIAMKVFIIIAFETRIQKLQCS